MHCALLQAGDLQVIVGDASRNGVGGTQYCGVWSLTSRHWPFNVFGNSYAGLIPTDIRGHDPRLTQTDERTVELIHPPSRSYPCEVRATYRVIPPYYIDHELTLRDHQDMRLPGCEFREVAWCSYMNCPEDPRLHFLSQDGWMRYMSPRHGVGSHIAPAYVPESAVEVFPPREDRGSYLHPFHWDRIPQRFDRPFYYGRVGSMVLMHLFDQPDWLRFFCSPSGGGKSLIPGQTCPAWDFEWIIPRAAYEVGQTYTFRMRLVYKPFVSDEEVITGYQRCVFNN